MSTFDEREKGFEQKFKHDQELQFKVEARRNKLLGLWAAEKMGMSGDAADTYAKEVIVADFEEAGDEDVFRKVAGDLEAKGVTLAESEIRERMSTLLTEAKAQLMGEIG